MAENKGKQWKWSLLHALVVTLCTSAFSYSFGKLLITLVLLNGVIHFFMDYNKESICKALHISGLSGFLFDQLIHITLLYLTSLTAIYSNKQFLEFKAVKILIVLAVITSFSAVFTQFVLATLFPRADSRFFEKGEKYLGIFTRVYAAFVFYISLIQSPFYLLLLGIIAATFFLQFKHSWSKWMSPSHLFAKMLLDTVISAVCIFPLILCI